MAPRDRDWSSLAAGSKRRWVSVFGGPRSLPAADRARRAERAYQAGAHLPVEHTGHAAPPEVTWSGVATTEGVREITTRTRVEARRVGEYARDVRELLEGDLDLAAFARRWSRRKREAGGAELESNPNRVIVMFAASGPAPEPFYRRRLRRAA
jgi:hypothetical protein